MKNHSFKRVISATLTILMFLSFSTFVSADSPANVDFYINETEGDIVELKVSVKNATFAAIMASVRYNPDALQPLNSSDSSERFISISKQAEQLDSINIPADSKKGFFGFIVYVNPDKKTEGVNDKNEFIADDKGIELYTFRFRRISDQSLDFEIASESETKPYQSSIPEGIHVVNYSGLQDVNVTFNYKDKSAVSTLIEAPARPVTAKERKQDVICLQVGKSLAITMGKKAYIDPEDSQVVPYITNDRTLVPLRFIVENLGAEILWEDGWNGCIIKKDDTKIELTFGSAEFKVNGKTFVYDAPIEITRNRTMVPVRFISEHLGCHVYWNELNKAVVISPKDNPWVEDRKAEITVLNEMLVTLLGII